MKSTIISSNASNWVDQGHPPHRVMRRVLAFFLGRREPEDTTWLDDETNVIIGMVAADANEVEVGNYLRSLLSNEHPEAADHDRTRLTAIALWHIAKVALVRDFAERVLQHDAARSRAE